MRFSTWLICLLAQVPFHTSPAFARSAVDSAFDAAVATFERALPQLGSSYAGVDSTAYRDALTLRSFTSPHWGAPVSLAVRQAEGDDGNCARYVAYVTIPPRNGEVSLSLCPEFLTPGTEALRVLTILHEVVHAVAGPDECRAMAFAAHVEQLGSGQHTDVSRYWRANNCQSSAFSLP